MANHTEWRYETPTGTFTIINFKPKECWTCNKPIVRNHCTVRKSKLCKVCNNRELTTRRSMIRHLTEIGQFFDVPKWSGSWLQSIVKRATITLEN